MNDESINTKQLNPAQQRFLIWITIIKITLFAIGVAAFIYTFKINV